MAGHKPTGPCGVDLFWAEAIKTMLGFDQGSRGKQPRRPRGALFSCTRISTRISTPEQCPEHKRDQYPDQYPEQTSPPLSAQNARTTNNEKDLWDLVAGLLFHLVLGPCSGPSSGAVFVDQGLLVRPGHIVDSMLGPGPFVLNALHHQAPQFVTNHSQWSVIIKNPYCSRVSIHTNR